MLAAPCIAAQSTRRAVHLVVAAALLAGLVAGLVGPAPRSALAATATTTADLNLRSGPGTTYEVLRVMPSGTAVTLDGGQEGNWYRVTYGGTSGWASGDFLSFSGGDGGGGGGNDGGGATGSARVAVDALNLRSSASTDSAVLAVMPRGAGVTLTGQRSNGFASVTYNGTNGWAYESYLTSGSSGGDPGPSPAPDPAPAPQPGPSGSATVAVNALNLRSGASTNAGVLAVMPYGAGVTLTGQRSNGFVSVTYNGTNGWAYESYLNIGGSPAPNPSPSPNPAPNPDPGPGPTGSATVAVDALNLRSSASTDSAVLAVMPRGAGVTLTGQRSNGFASVTYNGVAGWAYEAYLTIGGSPAPNPSPSPAPTQPTAPEPGSGTAVTTANMNMRSSASTNASVVTVVPAGATVTLTGIAENGFYYVIYNGSRGWISSVGLVLGGSPSPNPGGGNLRGDTNGDGALSQQEVIEIIYAAADRYGQPRADMLRVARCESNLDPNAINPSGSYGLFQFIRSTWATTPYAEEDIFDAYASANAAGWMWSVGRRNEWVCQ